MYDIIIIGAGPAGLTAAIYARRASQKVLVLEAKNYGGSIINTLDIENYPVESHISGYDLATKLYNQVKELNAEIKFEKVIEIKNNGKEKEIITSKNTYTSKAIIIATGSENRKLSLPGENDLIGKGISYCATCDGAFYKNKIVAVIGGGNTALEDAIYLSNIADTVYLIHRKNEFRADEITLSRLKEKNNIKVIYNSNITKINSDNVLKSVEVTDKEGNVNVIAVDGLFIAIGRIPQNENFKNIIKLDSNGYIEALEDCHTNIEGIYVAGDNRTKSLRQLVTATSDGAIAATEAIKYINNEKGEKNV